MQQHAGVFRTQALMDEGVGKVKALAERVEAIHLGDKSKVFNTARIEALEVDNLIESAHATMVSAAARRECRGAHTVSDYERPIDDPQDPNGRNDAEWLQHTLWYSEGNRLDYKPVNLKPQTRRIDPARRSARSEPPTFRSRHAARRAGAASSMTQAHVPDLPLRPGYRRQAAHADASRSSSTAASACCSTR